MFWLCVLVVCVCVCVCMCVCVCVLALCVRRSNINIFKNTVLYLLRNGIEDKTGLNCGVLEWGKGMKGMKGLSLS